MSSTALWSDLRTAAYWELVKLLLRLWRILRWRWSHLKLAAIALRKQLSPKLIETRQLPYWELVKLLLRLLGPLSPRRIFRWR